MAPRIPSNYVDFSSIVEDGIEEFGQDARVWETSNGEIYCTEATIVEPSARRVRVEWDGAVFSESECNTK